MDSNEQLSHAKAFSRKAEAYLASAEDNLVAERYTAAAGDAIHAGISAKESVVPLGGPVSTPVDFARWRRTTTRWW